MNVKVVSITKSLVTINHIINGVNSLTGEEMTAEQLMVYIARVSNPSNQTNMLTSEKLIKYLIDHKHWSPLDMVNLCVEVKTSRAIAAQILRHWSIKPQEFSQRYAEAVEVEPIELRLAGSTTRQGSKDELADDFIITFLEEWRNDIHTGKAKEIVQTHVNNSVALYRSLLDAGVAKECARMVLPLATTTTMYLNGSIRSWVHYLEQRTSAHAQKEHRIVAQEIEKIFALHFPATHKAVYNG